MLIVLSQKIDTESEYNDDVYKTYHYPRRYRNQIHEGDTFVYYQGNRYDKSQRYYFGMGKVGKITAEDEENYYADLLACQIFEKKVPINLPDGGHIEALGYETVRKRMNPLKAYESVPELKEELKKSIHSFYIGEKNDSLLDILRITQKLCRALGIKT